MRQIHLSNVLSKIKTANINHRNEKFVVPFMIPGLTLCAFSLLSVSPEDFSGVPVGVPVAEKC